MSFLSAMKAFRPFHRIALIDFLSGASFSSKMAHRTAELWTFENSMFDFGTCCKVLGHRTITTGFSSKNHAQRWHWRPKLPTRTDRQCRLEKYSGLSHEPFSNRMGGLVLLILALPVTPVPYPLYSHYDNNKTTKEHVQFIK